jgi:hypothetical protein
MELSPVDSGSYDATLHLAERNGWGDSKVEGIVSLLSGLPYSTVYPEFYNLGRDAVNFTSLARWDSEKRRIFLSLSMPMYGDPGLRLRFYADGRNENWNLSRTFLERRGGGCQSEFQKSRRPYFAGRAYIFHQRDVCCRMAEHPATSVVRTGAQVHAQFFG